MRSGLNSMPKKLADEEAENRAIDLKISLGQDSSSREMNVSTSKDTDTTIEMIDSDMIDEISTDRLVSAKKELEEKLSELSAEKNNKG